MNTCSRIEDYFAGVLQGEEKEAFERHLATCPRCERRLQQLIQLDKELRKRLPRTLPGLEVRPSWLAELVRQMRTC